MSVYVDNVRIPATVGRYTAHWSHLFTDSPDLTELHELAARIGLRRAWFQDKASGAHYDVTERKRVAAIVAGAHPIDWWEAGTVWRVRRTPEQGRNAPTVEGVR